MKKILFSLLLAGSISVFAQQSKSLVVADGMLASANFMKVNAKNIKAQKTYAANAALPTTLSNFSNTSKSGLVSLSLKDNYYDRISLGELNLQFKLDATNPVMYNGILFNNTDLLIFGDVLKTMEVKMLEGKNVLSITSDQKS